MKTAGLYPCVRVDAAGSVVVSRLGGLLLIDAVRAGGLDEALAPWRKPLAGHDPAKVVCDLAVGLRWGDCLADVAVLRGAPAVFGLVASDPPVSRTVDALAGDDRVLKALAPPVPWRGRGCGRWPASTRRTPAWMWTIRS